MEPLINVYKSAWRNNRLPNNLCAFSQGELELTRKGFKKGLVQRPVLSLWAINLMMAESDVMYRSGQSINNP